MTSRPVKRLAVPLAFAALLGCAGVPERKASDVRREIERGYQGIGSPERELPALTESSTLDDYLRYAMLHNPGLEAAFNRWRAALERVPQATALPEPRLTVMAMWMEDRSDPAERRLEASQAFPWFGVLRLRGAVALAEAEAVGRDFDKARLTLAYRVKEAYYELYYLNRAVGITSEIIDLVKYIESITRSRYQVASGEYADVIRAQVELGRVEDEVQRLADMKRPAMAKLNAALNRATEAPLPWPKAIRDESLEAADDQVLAAMREASPELKALDAEIAKQTSALELARKSYYPEVMVGLRYADLDPDGGMDTYSVMPMLTITLPIWRGKYRAATNEAQALRASAQQSLADRRNTLEAEVQMALFQFRDAARRLVLYRDTLVPKADQAVRASQTAYKAAKATLADLIDAERVLLAFRLAGERALTDRAQRLAELEMLVGRGLAHTPAPAPAPPPKPEAKEK